MCRATNNPLQSVSDHMNKLQTQKKAADEQQRRQTILDKRHKSELLQAIKLSK
jgi:hypothetical protein